MAAERGLLIKVHICLREFTRLICTDLAKMAAERAYPCV
jgi:hypothetical protein